MMKIGFRQFEITPDFPVQVMTLKEKTADSADALHCRVLIIEPENQKPWYHVSIDVVEVWQAYRDEIKANTEALLGKEIDMVVSATHAHVTPFVTTDPAWREFLMKRIMENIGKVEMKEYNEVSYSYNWHYFDKVGKSREADLKHVANHLYAETLSFYGDGKRIGTILIHNCHPTIKKLFAPPMTSEYPGYCIQKLSEKYPGEFFTFLLGPAGDISPHFVRENQEYDQIAVLGDKLIEEFERQMAHQNNLHPIDHFRYRETILPIEKGPREIGAAVFPPQDQMTPQEVQVLERRLLPKKDKGGFNPHSRELDPMEIISEYRICQLILSDEYSIVFEPAELYSEFYGSVNKQTTTLATISNGFDHYITGLYLNHITTHSITDYGFTDRMRRNLWERLAKMSLQLPDEEL